MKCVLVIAAAVSVLFCELRAQDIHFSLFTYAPLNINPATAGFFDGQYRGSLHYRNQWASMGHAYNTMAASYDMPFAMKKRKGASFGLGTFIFTDKAGDAGLGTSQANICGSGIIPLSAVMKISAGLNLAYAQQSVNLTSLNFGTQYNGTGFDPNVGSGENGGQSFSFFDAGAGFNFQYSNVKGNIARDNIIKINVGGAGYHLNFPRQSFYSSGGDRLHPRFVGHTDARVDIPGTKFSVLPSFLFMQQGPNAEMNFGCVARYRMRNATKITGTSTEMALSAGLHYRWKDAILPSLYFETGNIAFGLAYDLNVSSYKEVSHMNGGFEISIRYINMMSQVFEKDLKPSMR